MFAAGLTAVFTIPNILMIILGVFVGIVFGCIPGLTTTMAVALAAPYLRHEFDGGDESDHGTLYRRHLGRPYIGYPYHIPGTPASVATCFDGHPMAKRGEAARLWA